MAQAKDLVEFINFQSLECLNAQPSHPAENALKQGYREDGGLFLESDTDEQLLINIPFNQAVKLHSLVFGAEGDQAPKLIKLYVNRPSMGFSDTSSVPCDQEVSCTEAQLAGQPINLKYVKFQNVLQLSIFVEGNQGEEDTTKIAKIGLYGFGGETFNVAEIKKQNEER